MAERYHKVRELWCWVVTRWGVSCNEQDQWIEDRKGGKYDRWVTKCERRYIGFEKFTDLKWKSITKSPITTHTTNTTPTTTHNYTSWCSCVSQHVLIIISHSLWSRYLLISKYCDIHDQEYVRSYYNDCISPSTDSHLCQWK